MAPQSGRPITDEIATVEKDIYQDYIGKTLLNPDKVLKSEAGGKGIELYEDLLRDDKVGSTLQTRKLAVVGKEWDIEPASEKRADQKIAELVRQVLLGCNYDAARRSLLSGLVMGFKPAEIMWEYSEGQVWIKEIIGRASRRFVFDTERRLRLITLTNMIEGEELPERKFIVFTNDSDNGSPYGDGLGRLLYWPVWFKKNGVKFWSIYLDKFGSPTAIGKYPPGTEPKQQTALLDAIDAIQQESAIKIPDNMQIELLEATRSGAVNTYEGFCNFWNSAIAQIILGQTLTSDIGDKGSYAASQTHEDVRQDYLKADADALCELQNNGLIKWIVDYNFPNVTAYPKVWIRTDPEKNLKPLAERDKILIVDMGLPVAKKYLYETYGITEPEEGQELLETPSATSNQQPANGQEPKGQTQGQEFAEEPDWVSQYMETLSPSLQKVRQSALDEIEQWLRSLPGAPDEIGFISHVEGILGSAFSAVEVVTITDVISKMYGTYRGIRAAFGGPDIRSINFLADLDRFYISKWIQNPDAVATVRDFLSERYLTQGAGLFGRGVPEDIQAFRNLFSQKLADLEDWQIRRIVDTSAQRVRNWGSLAQMHEAGIAEIEIYEPTKDCGFCAKMNGRTISVSTAYNTMVLQSDMSPQQYEQELGRYLPVEENTDAFVAKGLLPPYHPHCHGRVIRRRT